MENTEPNSELNGRFQAEILEDDRRLWPRRPPNVEPTFVWVSLDRRIQTRMRDQSDGGLSILASRDCEFEVGFQLRVEVEPGNYRMARIVYVGDHDDDRLCIGLSWEDV